MVNGLGSKKILVRASPSPKLGPSTLRYVIDPPSLRDFELLADGSWDKVEVPVRSFGCVAKSFREGWVVRDEPHETNDTGHDHAGAPEEDAKPFQIISYPTTFSVRLEVFRYLPV